MAEQSFFDKVASKRTHVPDVLSCIANLSNDEVFTPPEVVNKMLDLLPQELFANSETTFLDPATKTGVFLREIAKRCLAAQLPNYENRSAEITEKKALGIPLDEYDTAFQEQLQDKIDHIFHKQLYGIAITELTSLLARRSLYCSKYPNGPYSITHFDDAEGNIRFRRTEHVWKNGKCMWCGASQTQYDRDKELESHAYEFIHMKNSEDIFKMKFDVIISNPPYQLSDGGGMGTSAMPIYNKFVEQAKKLNPRYLTMIIPSRWFAGGKGLDDFRNSMLHDKRIRHLSDYFNATDCFPGVDISGGVCYFLWDRDSNGDCKVVSYRGQRTSTMVRPLLENNADTFMRFNEAVSILRKVQAYNEPSFADIVSTRKPFGLEAKDTIFAENGLNRLPVYAYPHNGYISRDCIRSNNQAVEQYKVFISKAYGERGDFPYLVIGKPFLGIPKEVCTETYLLIGATPSKEKAESIISYMTTKFFRLFVLFKKNTQNAAKNVYDFVPMQDFTKLWTDEELYKKYDLTQDEIDFIESMIKPMDLGGTDNG